MMGVGVTHAPRVHAVDAVVVVRSQQLELHTQKGWLERQARGRERIFIELMTSDRKLKAFRQCSQ